MTYEKRNVFLVLLSRLDSLKIADIYDNGQVFPT